MKKEKIIDISEIFQWHCQAYDEKKYQTIVHQGSSRSSKTSSILFWIICKCREKPIVVTIARRTLAASKKSTQYGPYGFFDILKKLNIYDSKAHNKTECTYDFPNGSRVQFVGALKPDDLAGLAQDITYINECSEVSEASFKELSMRTSDIVVCDFNPRCNQLHWVWNLIKDKETKLIHSTYKNNPFLPKRIINFIENLKGNAYKIYALGLPGVSELNVFQDVKYFDEWPEGLDYNYGIDYGFNDPTCITKCGYKDGKVYIQELLYEPGNSVTELLSKIEKLNLNKSKYMYCEHEPSINKDLQKLGYNIRNADKKNKLEMIRWMQQQEVYIHSESENAYKEFISYSWKEKDGIAIEGEYQDGYDHSFDASIYGLKSYMKGNSVLDNYFL